MFRLRFFPSDWIESPSDSAWARWFGGVIMPAVLALCGVRLLLLSAGLWGGDGWRVFVYWDWEPVVAASAGLVGVALVGGALFGHSQWFHSERGSVFSRAVHHFGRLAGAGMVVFGVGWMVVSEIVFGMR